MAATGLGTPSISTPNALSLRPIAMAIDNIRQRLQSAEAAINAAAAASGATTSSASAQVKVLQQQLTALANRVLALESAASTDMASFTAGETILTNQGVVPIGDNLVGAADASDPTRMFGLIGIATNSANAGATVLVQRRGAYTVLGGTFVPDRAVYATHAGLTQHPDYEATALLIGVATTPTQIFIDPGDPALITPTFSSAIQGIYEAYLPVTYRALQFLAGLESQIDGLPFSSGVDSHAQVPVTMGGIAFRVNAADIAALATVSMLQLFGTLPFNSGASADMLVPVEIGGTVVLVRAGDIAALGGGGGGGLTVTEVDGTPSGTVTTLVFPNGTLTIVGSIATYTPAGGGGGIAFSFSSTAPVSPNPGDHWVDATSGIEYQWLNDGTSSQWVEF